MVAYNEDDDSTPNIGTPTMRVDIEEPFKQAILDARLALIEVMERHNIKVSAANACYLTGIMSIITFRDSPYYKNVPEYQLAAVLYATTLNDIHNNNPFKKEI
jgi:hypothetical protein